MVYYIFKYFMKPFLYIFFLPKIVGRENMKIEGKAIIISNHKSMADPLLISELFRRKIRWMGKKELFKNKILAAFFHAVGTFPVKRGENDLAAIRHAFRVLRDGEILGIFPEGTRAKSDDIRTFEQGASMIALKNKAPVVPIYIKGNYKLFRRVTITIGEPIMLADYVGKGTNSQTAVKATKFLENKLKDMKEAKV